MSYNDQAGFPPAPPYRAIREFVPPFRNLPSEQIEALFAETEVSAEDVENFFKTLGNIGKTVAQAAPAILPVVGGALGSFIPIPGVGTALGAAAGRFAGQALAGATSGGGQAQPRPPTIPQIGPRPPAMPGSPSAAQLLRTMLTPQTLQALTGMALGSRQSVPVGGTQVPAGAFANLLGVLANQAAMEFSANSSSTRLGAPLYMQDYAGESPGDPAVAEHRASALLELLENAFESGGDSESAWAEYERDTAETEFYEAFDYDADDYYDAIDLLDLYGDSEVW